MSSTLSQPASNTTTASATGRGPALPQLIVCERDAIRLGRIVQIGLNGRFTEEAELLEAELARAQMVADDDVPSDVVTLDAAVVVDDIEAGTQRSFTLVAPEDANASAGRVSVLAPMGAAVIGLRCGAEIAWPLPNGRKTRLRVASVTQAPVERT